MQTSRPSCLAPVTALALLALTGCAAMMPEGYVWDPHKLVWVPYSETDPGPDALSSPGKNSPDDSLDMGGKATPDSEAAKTGEKTGDPTAEAPEKASVEATGPHEPEGGARQPDQADESPDTSSLPVDLVETPPIRKAIPSLPPERPPESQTAIQDTVDLDGISMGLAIRAVLTGTKYGFITAVPDFLEQKVTLFNVRGDALQMIDLICRATRASCFLHDNEIIEINPGGTRPSGPGLLKADDQAAGNAMPPPPMQPTSTPTPVGLPPVAGSGGATQPRRRALLRRLTGRRRSDPLPEAPEGTADIEAPTAALFGFIGTSRRREAVDYVRSVAGQWSEAPDLVAYGVTAVRGGFLYEIHEGGGGRAWLPSVLRHVTELRGDGGKPEGAAERPSIFLRCAGRLTRFIPDDQEFYVVTMPEEYPEAAALERGVLVHAPEIRGPRLKPLLSKGNGLLWSGGAVLATGLVALIVAGGMVMSVPRTTEPTVARIGADLLPHRQWNLMVDKTTTTDYVEQLTYSRALGWQVKTAPRETASAAESREGRN